MSTNAKVQLAFFVGALWGATLASLLIRYWATQ